MGTARACIGVVNRTPLLAGALALVAAACGGTEGSDAPAQAVTVARRPSNPRCVANPAGAPTLLTQLGCSDPINPRAMAAGVVEYEPQAPLWSDGTDKPRYFAIPDGTKIHVETDGRFTFPNGTVLFKSFSHDNKLVETRVLLRYDDGSWGAYSYEWNDAQTDATKLDSDKTKELGGGLTWTFPSRDACFVCHNGTAGTTLGPVVAQLNGPIGRSAANQLEMLSGLGYLDAPLPPAASLPKLPRYEDTTVSVEERARAYLHGNCAHCHQPNATGFGTADYRFSTPFAGMGICEVKARTNPRVNLFTPGSSATSLLSQRMHKTGPGRMPMIGTTLVDPIGTSVVDRWIDATTSCAP